AALIAVVLLGAAACGADTGGVTPTPSVTNAPSSGGASSASEPTDPAADATLSPFGYPAADAVRLVDELDATPVDQRPVGMMASVRPGELQLTGPDGRKARLALPTDRFYLSIAPYLQGTHECHFHSLTT